MAIDKSSEHVKLTLHRTRKILVIDRCDVTLALTAELLERAGFLALCHKFSVGAAAFAARERIDAAVIELDVPLSRGDLVARNLRQHASLATLPIVLMTSEGCEQSDKLTLPGVVMLTKAIVPLALVPSLRSLIDHRVQAGRRERAGARRQEP